MLQRHEAALPDPANSIKTQCLVDLDSGRLFLRSKNEAWLNIAYRAPWEKERQDRILALLPFFETWPSKTFFDSVFRRESL